MKLKRIVNSVFATVVCMGSIGYAHANDYNPPERLYCTLSAANRVACHQFNRQYLTEDVTNADLQQGKDEVFHFVSAVAYFSAGQAEASVFFTYNNTHFKMVKLKTINPFIRPDIANGYWKRIREDIYTCDAGYMHCGLTNLPTYQN